MYFDAKHIQHYGRLTIERACISVPISVPIINSKLLCLANQPLVSPSSFERKIGTEIHTRFIAVILDVMLNTRKDLVKDYHIFD